MYHSIDFPFLFRQMGAGPLYEAPAFLNPIMRTYIYVHWFNLFYQSVNHTPFKWLDLSNLFREILQSPYKIEKIKYFTARVSAHPNDTFKPERQNTYDSAIIVTNDSDVSEAMRLVKMNTDKPLGLLTPGRRHPSQHLLEFADFHRHIRKNVLENNQLPSRIPGTNLTKPRNW